MSLRAKLLATLILVGAVALVVSLGVTGAFSSTEPNYSQPAPSAPGAR